MQNTSAEIRREFEELFKQNYSRMFYCALDLVADAETAKDIVGDACCETWRRIGDITACGSKANVAAYMLSTVRNRALNHLRHKNVEDSYIKDALLAGEFIATESAAEHEARLERLFDTLESLSPQTKRVFEMCWFDGLKYQEAANELGVSISAVHKHVSKAFAAFRKAFGVKMSSMEVTILVCLLLLI